jgi:CO dehydrogenase/acetyl-CoA synthase beta subunit
MTVFDPYVGKVAEYVECLRAKGREIRTFQAPLSSARLSQELPFRVGPGANPGIILRGDTSVELGNPEMGSSSLFLLTDSPATLKDGRITLIGPDIPESANTSLPFGQVLMLGGAQLADKDVEALQPVQFVGDQIEGYMMRGVSQRIWSRISTEAVAKGMCFNLLGQALMAVCRSASRKLESMEILFVTSGKEDLDPLDGWSVQIQKIAREIIKENWRIKGYDIDCASNCATCKGQVVCGEIKEVLRERQMNDHTMEGVST